MKQLRKLKILPGCAESSPILYIYIITIPPETRTGHRR